MKIKTSLDFNYVKPCLDFYNFNFKYKVYDKGF